MNAAYGINGNHGFDFSIPVSWGHHSIAVYAINVGGAGPGNPLIGTGSVTTGVLPVGSLDSAGTAPGSTIRLRGWAFDPDRPTAAIQVAVYRDGGGIAWFPTGLRRPDVNSVFGITGNHGFDITIASPPGEHSVQVYAINVAGGVGNPLIGAGNVRVGVPMGSLDRVTATGRTVRLSGWAFDPDQPNAAIQIAVYRDGVGVSWFPSGGNRPDVNAVFGITGNHGFDISVDTPPGTHSFDVYAINVGPAAGNPHIGRKSVRVN